MFLDKNTSSAERTTKGLAESLGKGRVPNQAPSRIQGFWQRLFGRKADSAAPASQYPPSTNSIGLSHLGAGAELYAQLKRELETISHFQRNSAGAFARRLDQLIEIDHGVEALMVELFQPDIAEKWQANIGLRGAFGRRLAQISTRLALAYRDLLDEGRRKYPGGSRGAQRLPNVACRAIVHIGLAMRWNCYANKREPSTSWGRLYRLYRFAEKRAILRDKIELGSGSTSTSTTCHQEFARIILFGLAEPIGLAPEMIDAAYGWCGEWSELIEFTHATDVEGEQHCFDMEGDLPPSQFHPKMQSDRMRCFSTAAVCFKVASVRETSPMSAANAADDGAIGTYTEQMAQPVLSSALSNGARDDLIRHLMRGWVKARSARRIERATDGLKVARVACGPDAINELLYAESKPDAGIPPEFSFEHWSIENESTPWGSGMHRPGRHCARSKGMKIRSPAWR